MSIENNNDERGKANLERMRAERKKEYDQGLEEEREYREEKRVEEFNKHYKEVLFQAINAEKTKLGRELTVEERADVQKNREQKMREIAWEKIKQLEKNGEVLEAFRKLDIIREADENRPWFTLKDIEDTKASGFFVAPFMNVKREGIFEIKGGEMTEESKSNFHAYAGSDSGQFFSTREEAKKYADKENKKR